MSLIKLENTNANVFTVKGIPYLKGQYRIEYNKIDTTGADGEVSTANKESVGVKLTALSKNLDPNVQEPWKGYKSYKSFLDSTETAYADFDTFALALANMVALPNNAATSDLISDKGTVTQASSITTGVTLSNANGVVTTVSSTLAADTSANFTITNTKVTTASNIQVSATYAGTQGAVAVNVVSVSSGSFVLKVLNLSSTQALNAAIKINFLVC